MTYDNGPKLFQKKKKKSYFYRSWTKNRIQEVLSFFRPIHQQNFELRITF